ncbi:MAG: SRPBCC family protein [Chloroflexi bacterium]|nr:MAG: SRPBCC family protein [Chloroflexota bacterium]
MKKFLKLVGVLFAVAIVGVGVIAARMPWMDRWGATEDEIAASFPGDELVPSPRIFYNRAITVNASPEEIYPWIVQLGAERGGMYSYTWFETNILQCELINADRIHEEWQSLNVGDKVKMCPGDFGPVPYEVAIMEANHAIVMGHQEQDQWLDVWQFILVPHADGTTRLILRSRDMKTGGFWDVIRPGVFVMERGMLLGIKERAEGRSGQ